LFYRDIGLNKKDQHRREKYGAINDYGYV